ncbi:MAG TPA: winged helix-turn-helix domain-containing protein [Nitrososphaeraceae archaeon]
MESVSRLEVVYAILQESRRGSDLYRLRTKLSTCLNASDLNKYLLEMSKHGLICPTRKGFHYDTTSKGALFLMTYRELSINTPSHESIKFSPLSLVSGLRRFLLRILELIMSR